MQFTTAVSTILFAGAALAQAPVDPMVSSAAAPVDPAAAAVDPAAAAAAPTDPAAAAAAGSDVNVMVVKVGSANGSTTFEPNNLQAPPGTMVQFQFWPKNHSVVQSTFDQPCMPINMNMPNVTGLYSGFMPVTPESQMMPTYTVMVNDTKPVWLYCSQAKHCQNGMVMAINAKTEGEKTIEAYKQLAGAASENLSPGQMPSAGAASNSTGSASPTGGAVGGAGGDAGATPPSPSSTGESANSVAGNSASSVVAGSSLSLAAFVAAFALVL